MKALKIQIAVVLVGVSFLCSPLCYAQGSFMRDITTEGQLISEGGNTAPVGELKATTYRLELLPTSATTETERRPQFKRFRLVIKTREELPMAVFSIWMDGEETYGAEQIDPKSVAMLFHARSLRNGMSLGLSIRGKTDLASRSVLPETLYVPPEYATPQEELEVRIILRRVPGSQAGMIQMKIESKSLDWYENCQTTNQGCGAFIEIEGERVGLVNYFTPQKFAQLRDGAEIVLKRGRHLRDAQTVRILGRLDKSTIR